MADYIVPADWKLFSREGNQSTYVLPGHTVTRPYLAIFSRKVPVFKGNSYSVPEYRVRIIRGVVSPTLGLLATRQTADVTFRGPVEGDATDLSSIIGVLGVMCSNADFQNDVAVEQLLP